MRESHYVRDEVNNDEGWTDVEMIVGGERLLTFRLESDEDEIKATNVLFVASIEDCLALEAAEQGL